MIKRMITVLTVAAFVATPFQASAATTAPPKPVVVTDKAVRNFTADADSVLYQEADTKDLFLRDLKSGQTHKVDDHVSGPYFGLDGSKAAYTVYNEADKLMKLYVRDLTTNQRTEVVADRSTIADVAMKQGKLVWSQPEGDQWVVRLRDLNTGVTRELTRIPNSDHTSPAQFDGRYLVWTQMTGTSRVDTFHSRIFALDTTTGQQQVKANAGAMQSTGVADGTVLYAMWTPGQTRENTTDTLYMWDVAANTQQWLAAATRPYANGSEAAIGPTDTAWTDTTGTHIFNVKTGTYDKLGEPGIDLTFAGNWLVYRLPDDNGAGTAVRAVSLAPADSAVPPAEPTKPVFYTVQSGDTLWKLSQRFKVAVAEMARSNNMLNPNVISVGQVLSLPYPVSPRGEAVVVQPGETLGQIAARYKTTVYSIAMTNQLTRADVVNAGQVLKVSRGPEAMGGATMYQTYAVQPGDSLWNISVRSGVSIQQLMANNQWQQPVPLSVGQTIIIRK